MDTQVRVVDLSPEIAEVGSKIGSEKFVLLDRDEYVREHGNEHALRLISNKLFAAGQRLFPSARIRRLCAAGLGIKISGAGREAAWLARDVYLDEVFPELITIGKGAVISLRAMIICHDDATRRVGPIQIGDHAFIGAASILLPGIQIGNGAKIGAGAVVTKSVPAGQIWAGVPAKPVN